jgi:hypothetical protein
VVRITPEGAVVDASRLPDLKPGTKVGFRRPDGGTSPVGEGFVLDVREGQALVGLRPGAAVQAGDQAVLCAALTGEGSQEGLRASVEALKAQVSPAGSGPAGPQATIAQIESTLDAREAAIRAGTCDVASHDEQIAALSVTLQQQLTSAQPASGQPSLAAPGQAASTGVAGSPDPAVAAASPTTADQGGTAPGGLTALQLVQQLFQMAQSMGLGGGRAAGGGEQAALPALESVPPAQSLLPVDSGTGQTGTPVGGAPPGAPSQPGVIPPAPVGAVPSPGGPAGGGPSTGGGTAPPPPGTPTAPPPGLIRPPVKLPPRTTLTPLKPTAPGPPAVSGSPSSGTGKPPALGVPPGTRVLPLPGSIARGQLQPQRMAVVQGVVRADSGHPLPGAVVSVAGKQAHANTQGVFVVTDVPLGQQTVVATAAGFLPGRLVVDLKGGEVEKVTLTLRRR